MFPTAVTDHRAQKPLRDVTGFVVAHRSIVAATERPVGPPVEPRTGNLVDGDGANVESTAGRSGERDEPAVAVSEKHDRPVTDDADQVVDVADEAADRKRPGPAVSSTVIADRRRIRQASDQPGHPSATVHRTVDQDGRDTRWPATEPVARSRTFDQAGPVGGCATRRCARVVHAGPTVPGRYRRGRMELLLIRHGLPLRIESDQPVDPPLAPLGHAQAQALAEWLIPHPPDRLLSSTMARAVDTADHVARQFGLEPTAEADFCEFDRGAKAYIPLEELDRDHPHMRQLIDDWIGPGGAERRAAFQAKVLAALHRHVDDSMSECTALVCHGGVINVILADVLGTDRMMFFQPDYTSVSRLAVSGGRFRLLSINEAAHLRGVDQPS